MIHYLHVEFNESLSPEMKWKEKGELEAMSNARWRFKKSKISSFIRYRNSWNMFPCKQWLLSIIIDEIDETSVDANVDSHILQLTKEKSDDLVLKATDKLRNECSISLLIKSKALEENVFVENLFGPMDKEKEIVFCRVFLVPREKQFGAYRSKCSSNLFGQMSAVITDQSVRLQLVLLRFVSNRTRTNESFSFRQDDERRLSE